MPKVPPPRIFDQDGSELNVVYLSPGSNGDPPSGHAVQDSTCGYYRTDAPPKDRAAWVLSPANAARFKTRAQARVLATQTAVGKFDRAGLPPRVESKKRDMELANA